MPPRGHVKLCATFGSYVTAYMKQPHVHRLTDIKLSLNILD